MHKTNDFCLQDQTQSLIGRGDDEWARRSSNIAAVRMVPLLATLTPRKNCDVVEKAISRPISCPTYKTSMKPAKRKESVSSFILRAPTLAFLDSA